MQWMQNYSALGGNLGLTAIAAVIPILYLFWALAIKRMKGHLAGSSTLLVLLIIAILVYHMPVSTAISAAALGAVTGLVPIGWIILAAVFLYNLMVESGQFEIFKNSIASVSSDRRIQSLIIAFSFSAFMEGVAGQGAPVAVVAAMLIGMGFAPMTAATIGLIGNTPPVPFGPIGVPTLMMGTVTGLGGATVARGVGMDMAILAIFIPLFMMIVLTRNWRSTVEVLPAILVAGFGFAIPCLLITRFIGPELASVISSGVSLLCMFALMKVWRPQTVWRFANDTESSAGANVKYTSGQVFRAWSPFLVLIVIMLIWAIPSFKAFIGNDLKLFLAVPHWPLLDGIVYQVAPVVAKPAKYAASYRLDYILTPGSAILLVSIICLPILGVSPSKALQVFGKTFMQLRYTFIMLMSVIGIGFLANYSGVSHTLGLALALYTGMLFPIFSPIIGLIGTFMTGSVTSSAALFGKLQQVTAGQIGVNQMLTITASVFGSVAGKLISPQSIAIACGGVGMVGQEPGIFRRIIPYAIMILVFVIVIVLIEAWIVPGIWAW